MNPKAVKIINYSKEYQSQIDVLMAGINKEFEKPIYIPNQGIPKLDKYWLALSDKKVIGTLGLEVLDTKTIVLKRMFVNKKFRGKGIAKSLLDTLLKWAKENNASSIILGTMNQFKAAQKFYERNGFKRIEQIALPENYPLNPLDDVFYRLALKSKQSN